METDVSHRQLSDMSDLIEVEQMRLKAVLLALATTVVLTTPAYARVKEYYTLDAGGCLPGDTVNKQPCCSGFHCSSGLALNPNDPRIIARAVVGPTVKMAARASTVTIWEQADDDAQMELWDKAGQLSIAAMILTLWEMGQRVADARLFRNGVEYQGGNFRFQQSKSGSYLTILVSQRLQTLL
jgi:hypothetical protein